MKCHKQFIDVEPGICRLVSDEDRFVPEMSLPVKDILQQFAFVDQVRIADLAQQGYDFADNNEDDFDVDDFDNLDPAEKDEIYRQATEIVDRYQKHLAEMQEMLGRIDEEDPSTNPPTKE